MAKMNIKVERELMTVLLDKVQSGQIAVPRFQRDYIWSPKQITEFFDSILRRYPIGSLILWKPEKDHFKTIDTIEGIKVANDYEFSEQCYVLDGRQRLTTLISTLFENGNNARKYYVNIEKDDFQILCWNSHKIPNKLHYFSLSEALDSYALVGYLERLNQSNLPDMTKQAYATRAKEINKILMSYEISYTIVRGGYIQDAVEIFSRLNSKTTIISTDYMIQALAYNANEDFLFADAISEMKESLAEYGLSGISREVLLKCMYNYTDKFFIDGHPEDLLQLKDQLPEIATSLKEDVRKTGKFLNEECGIVDIKLLPYIYQFVMTALFFRHNKSNISEQQCKALKKWFFYTTYSSYYTNTSLGEIRKGLQTFVDYCMGQCNTPLQFDDNVSVLPLPEGMSMGSVRVCGHLLTQINACRPDRIDSFDVITIPRTGKRNAGNAVCCFSTQDRIDLVELFKNQGGNDSIQNRFCISDDQITLYKEGRYKDFCTAREKELGDIEKKFIINLFSDENINFEGITSSIEKKVPLDRRLVNILEWLFATTSLYINHPLDIDRLNEVANIVADSEIIYNDNDVSDFCLSMKWPETTAKQIVHAFQLAKEKRFGTMHRVDRQFLINILRDGRDN